MNIVIIILTILSFIAVIKTSIDIVLKPPLSITSAKVVYKTIENKEQKTMIFVGNIPIFQNNKYTVYKIVFSINSVQVIYHASLKEYNKIKEGDELEVEYFVNDNDEIIIDKIL